MVVCYKYGVFAVTNLPVSEGQSCVIVLGSEDLHPSTSHSNGK